MSRDIKFRAWDKTLKGMITPELFDDLLNGKEVAWSESKTTRVPKRVTEVQGLDIATGARPVIRTVDEWMDKTDTVRMKTYKGNPFALQGVVIMQYTGLKDKNGKEIYEGDIIKWQPSWYEDDDWDTRVIEFKHDRYNFHGTDVGIIEVIGNIYENPELLK